MRISWVSRVTSIVIVLLIALVAVFAPHFFSAKAASPAHSVAARLNVRPASFVLYDGNNKGIPGGDFITTLYGRGLQPQVTYTLVDSNTTCTDTINGGTTTVTTDMNGRLFLTIQGGPALQGGPACAPGTYTITASAGNSLVKASYTIYAAGPRKQRVAFAPQRVVLSSTGSFASSIVLRGQAPNAQFRIKSPADLLCGNGVAAFSFSIDRYGNSVASVFGGPDFGGGGPPCATGPHVYTVTVGSLTYQITLTLATAHP